MSLRLIVVAEPRLGHPGVEREILYRAAGFVNAVMAAGVGRGLRGAGRDRAAPAA